MRILHIGKYYPPFAGGMENFLGDLVPAQRAAGIDSLALVHAHRPRPLKSPVEAACPGVYRAATFGELVYAPVSPLFAALLLKVCRRHHPDILHFHLPNTSAFWALALPSIRKIPWVVHWHSDVVPSQIDRRLAAAYGIYRPLEYRMLRSARIVLATSPPYLHSSPTLRPWTAKCRVVPLALDPNRLRPPGSDMRQWAQAIWSPGKTRVLAVGRLTYYKGHDILIRAASAVPDLDVVIAGSGPNRRKLIQIAQGASAGGRVRLVGKLDSERLFALMQSCDCLCLPSVERTEAFGLVLLEAMRYGKPAVATSVKGSGMGWVVRDGVTGFLVPPGSPGELARGLEKISQSEALRDQMGQAAASRFNRYFRIDRVAGLISSIYQEAVSRQASVSAVDPCRNRTKTPSHDFPLK